MTSKFFEWGEIVYGKDERKFSLIKIYFNKAKGLKMIVSQFCEIIQFIYLKYT